MRETIAGIAARLEAELGVEMGDADRIAADCDAAAALLGSSPPEQDLERLRALGGFLRSRTGPAARALSALLEKAAGLAVDPWPILEPAIAARDPGVSMAALATAARLAAAGHLSAGARVAASLLGLVEASEGGRAAELLRGSAALLRAGAAPGDGDPVAALWLGGDSFSARALSARILDLAGEPVPPALAEAVLGREAFLFARPLLEFTRAGYLDLLHVAPTRGEKPPVLEDLRRAEAVCGIRSLGEIVSALGWTSIGSGLHAQRLTPLRVGRALPLWLRPEEAGLVGDVDDARRGPEVILVTAHGGTPGEGAPASAGGEDVARYRGMNLAHAQALSEILDLAPLDASRVARLVALLDRIVADHVALFAPHADECAILPSIWSDLRARIESAVAREGGNTALSAEVTRLVLAFDDPASAGAVTTLHGLKRYLHQRGLRLGFKLVKTVAATNREVSLALAAPGRPVETLRSIRYVDFEPRPGAPRGVASIPYPVAIVADGFARQFVHGHRAFPGVRVFCYGNEVHYYLTYGTHPAFVRIDFAPPLSGGMVDLEYYGVSRYDLEAHPGRDLEALRAFFGRMDYDVTVEPNTRVHARYDKERTRDLGDLSAKAEALFRLAPYLMDLDWKLGDLRLPPDAKKEAARAWSEAFALQGVLPLDRILSRDRLGVVLDVEEGASGEREILWDGMPPYRDRLAAPASAAFLGALRAAVDRLDVDEARFAPDAPPPLGQLALETAVFGPLRDALRRGEIEIVDGALARAPSEKFAREPEAEALARVLASGDAAVEASARLARLVAPLERTLTFRTTGAVNRHDVQRARLPLLGESLWLHALRGPRGMIRLALVSRGAVPSRRRDLGSEAWRPDASSDTVSLAAALRAAGYSLPGSETAASTDEESVESIRERFARTNPLGQPPPLPSERVVTGTAASPGRAVGRARLGTEGRTPSDLAGAVLFAPALRPEHGPFLHTAAGVATTGGGILSHAGLIATQYGKPAVIVPGRWEAGRNGIRRLFLSGTAFREEEREIHGHRVAVRRDARDREIEVEDGDLVVVDADQGALQVFAHDVPAAAVHDGIRALGGARRGLAACTDAAAILTLRGEALRARHRLESMLSKIADEATARFAVEEILLGRELGAEGAGEKSRLLSVLLSGGGAEAAARERLVFLGRVLSRRLREACDEAAARIPGATLAFEVLSRRLDVLRLREAQAGAALALRECGFPRGFADGLFDEADVDLPARHRLVEIRAALSAAVLATPGPDADPGLRHRLRSLERIDGLLGLPASDAAVAAVRARQEAWDRGRSGVALARHLLPQDAAGLETASSVGWKAANLAELERLAGPARVPRWFVVTDAAFREALSGPAPSPAGGRSLRDAIAGVLARADMDLSARAAAVRALWDDAPLPAGLAEDLAAAYASLGDADDPAPFVAVRSSAREEDTEAAANAGEFDTFLFVRGAESVIEHLKRAWAGLWNARALYARAVLGADATAAGGGVIVQRMVRSRVSGVLQTIHAAAAEPREIVVNAGLGLGEGIVAGAVGADQITVVKDGDLERGPLRFRYRTADKREQVVFDRRAGSGTVRVETAYHQRLRPALEYVELLELVGTAARLEDVFGYPLDIEFAFEGPELRLLQVRPVPAHDAALRETLERRPLPPLALEEAAL